MLCGLRLPPRTLARASPQDRGHTGKQSNPLRQEEKRRRTGEVRGGKRSAVVTVGIRTEQEVSLAEFRVESSPNARRGQRIARGISGRLALSVLEESQPFLYLPVIEKSRMIGRSTSFSCFIGFQNNLLFPC